MPSLIAKSLSLPLLLLLVWTAAGCRKSPPDQERGAGEQGATPRPAAPDVKAKVRAAVAEALDMRAADIDDDTPLSALKNPADELAVVEIIMMLEEAFKLDIPDEAIAGGKSPEELPAQLTVSKLASIVEQRLR